MNKILTDYERYRLYEIFPGLLIWTTLIVGTIASFWVPLFMMYAVIIFDVYWVLRVIYFSIYTCISWRRFRAATRMDWMAKLTAEFPHWAELKSVVFLPIVNESFEVVSATLDALIASSFPAQKLYIVLAGEGRKLDHWLKIQEAVEKKYSTAFAGIMYTTHPDNLPGEIVGKGSNIHHAEYEFKVFADKQGWRYEDIVISIFDIDTVVHKEYLSHLQYMYLSHPSPTRSSFQPVTLYNNNIWQSHAILRIMAFGTTFWMLFSLARLDSLVTFSSHSMSFKAVMDVGGHAKNIVSEDSRIFFQCWLHYDGAYEVTPLYVPVSMDTVHDETLFRSLKNLYYQQRRWAWGTENVPYLLWELRKHPAISWTKKWAILFHELEGKWSWAVVAILITIMGRLPLWFADESLRQSALFFNTPQVLQVLMTIAMAGLILSAVMTLFILPERPKGHRRHNYIFMLLQWVFLPVSLIIFSSLPCIDAVTHLMFAKYLGFNISKKRH